MISLSEKLRRERELRGISLKQISDDTKIGVRFLEALERDKLELIPGEFYRRSYLRAYARYLGLDEDRAVNAYAFSQKGPEDEENTAPTEPTAGVSWLPWLGLLTLGLLAGLLFLAFREGPGEDALSAPVPRGSRAIAAKPDAAGPAEEEAEEKVPVLFSRDSRVAPGEKVPAPVVAGASDGRLRLVVSVGESCWLEIETDGEVVTTGLKEKGYQREFVADREVRLWLGNAGGVSLWVNGRPLKSLGRPGQVRKDLAITPDNFMDFVGDDVS